MEITTVGMDYTSSHPINLYSLRDCLIVQRYYWVSMLEFATLLGEYERKDAKLKASAIRAENVYHDGVGMVDNTDIPWSTVNEMETRVVDDNVDIEFFLAYKQQHSVC